MKKLGDVARVVAAVLVPCAIAFVLRAALAPLLNERPYVLFLAAVAASTYAAGWRAGAAAVLLCVLITSLYIGPAQGHVISLGVIGSAVVFVFSSAIVIGALARERAATREVERSRELLRQESAERERLAAELEETKRLDGLGRLAGGIAHDFNNLLMVIRGSAEILHNELPQHQLIGSIQLAARRGGELTNQLLGFARRQRMALRPISLNEVVLEVMTLAERLIPKDIIFDVRLCEEPYWFDGDKAQVQRVLLNLLTNARDALPDGGRISIQTHNVKLSSNVAGGHGDLPPGDYVRLSIEDNGVGMPQEMCTHLFEPFFTTKGHGTGLGLPAVYGIVKQLKGHIAVKSAPGVGTAFDIYWPRSSREPAADYTPPSQSRAVARRGAQRLTILLVEDDESVRSVLSDMLRALGHEVLTAEDGGRALKIAERSDQQIDVLVTDVVMPGMNGREVYNRLLASRPNLGVVFVSGYNEDIVLARGAIDPCAQLLRKPFLSSDLEEALRVVAAREGAVSGLAMKPIA